MLRVAEILARTASVYASCRTYRDEGTTTTDVVEGPNLWPSRTTRVEFNTLFERSTGLLFTFRSFVKGPLLSGPEKESVRGVFRQQRLGAQGWATLQGRIFAPGHELSVNAGRDSVPGQTAALVVCLLLPDPSTSPVLPLAESGRDLGEDEVEGRRCVGVQGTTPAGENFDVWIDAETFLVLRRTSHSVRKDVGRQRRLAALQQELDSAKPRSAQRFRLEKRIEHAEEQARPTARLETTILWRPQIDIEIEPEALRFAPPE
jgi:hypothetical protein